jgi:hypothetical protein
MGTLSLEQSRISIYIYICLILYNSYNSTNPQTIGRFLNQNYAKVAAASSGLRTAFFGTIIKHLHSTLLLSSYYS